jgi:chromosome segregation ATPase
VADDDLRTVVLSFRASVAEQFDRIDRRLDALAGRIDALEGRMGALEGRMDALEGRMDGLEGRMSGLESRVGELADEIRDRTRTMEVAILNAIRDLARDVDRRLTRLEGGC